MKLLAADIGGTKSWLCLAEIDNEGKQSTLFERIYPSQNFKDATHLLEHFLQDANAQELKIFHMCLALPGVVTEEYASLTNLNWELDSKDLMSKFLIDNVTFINDFEAAAIGVSTMKREDYIILNIGKSHDKGIKVVTGAGTGLGMAWLSYQQGKYRANASEGGHIDFAPVTPSQISLLEKLMSVHSHVSYERLLSGEGLVVIYDFLKSPYQETITARKITQSALNGNELAKEAISFFVEIYGAYIGNLAMLYKPAGGIYIAGGIAVKILPWMQSQIFLSAYLHKGRILTLVQDTPLYLITNERLGLQGALSVAMQKKPR